MRQYQLAARKGNGKIRTRSASIEIAHNYHRRNVAVSHVSVSQNDDIRPLREAMDEKHEEPWQSDRIRLLHGHVFQMLEYWPTSFHCWVYGAAFISTRYPRAEDGKRRTIHQEQNFKFSIIMFHNKLPSWAKIILASLFSSIGEQNSSA